MREERNIECAVLTHQSKDYVLPIAAIIEIFTIVPEVEFLSNATREKSKMHSIFFKKREISVIAIDESEFLMHNACRGKIAIVNGIFSMSFQYAGYFGVYFDGGAEKIEVSSRACQWVDEQNKIAKWKGRYGDKVVTVFDLFQVSKKIEKMHQG